MNDAGPGLKQEFDYDAAGRTLQGRTVTTDGKLQVKVDYHYSSHGEMEEMINTSYWPNGKSPEKVAMTAYDENSNFTTEIVEDYDLSGKHVSGHKLFHDPMTGVYRCFDWNAAQQKHLAIDCPQSEESQDGPKEVHKINRDEVMQQLAAARKAAQAEHDAQRTVPQDPSAVTSPAASKEIGMVLPADMRPGQRVSGSLLVNPERLAAYPDLVVTRMTLPGTSTSPASPLAGWTVEMKGSAPQPADAPFSFVVPSGANSLEFTLRRADAPATAVSQRVQVPKATAHRTAAPQGFQSPALCFKRDLCMVAGNFSGDSRDTFAAFEAVPARVIAETDTAAYVDVPPYVNIGPSTLIVAEGTKVAAMAMVVADLSLDPARDELEPGRGAGTEMKVAGAEELGEQQWRYGVFPASNLARAQALVPGFNPPKAIEQVREQLEKQEKQDGSHKKEEKWEENAGMILVILRNTTPDIATMRGARQNSYIFRLTPDSFARGEFKFSAVIDTVKAGTLSLQATGIPFLAPVKAEIYEVSGPVAKK